MKKIIVSLGFVLIILGNLFSQNAAKISSLTVEKIWREYQFFADGVDGFKSMKDGESFTRIVNDKEKQFIVRYSFKDVDKKGDTIIRVNDLKYKGIQLRLDDYEWNEDETKLLLTVEQTKRYRRSFYAVYFLYDLKTKQLSMLDEERFPQTLASYSPNGEKVAYIYKNNLYVKDIKNNKISQITTDGEENKVINGTTDWVYEEEFAYTKAYEWSPNSEYISFLRFDESSVHEFTMTYYWDTELYPQPYTFKYPKAGEDNSKVTLHVSNINTLKTTQIQVGEYEYIPRIKFSTKENKFMVLTLNRHQNHIQYFWIDVLKEGMPAQMVYEERDDAYLEIDDNLFFLKDGKHFIRTSEKDGFNHIYLIGIDGSSVQITKGNWDVIAFEGINEDKGLVYYTSAEEGAPYSAVYSIDLKGKNKKKVSACKGSNHATFSNGMKYFINSWSTINTPPIYSLYKADGTLIKELENNKELASRIEEYGFQPKKFIQIQGKDQLLNAWILYPKDFDSTKKYPVYFNIYGGPGSNTVEDAYDGGNGAFHQLLAQKGYIVMSVDPRGTLYRGAKFKKSTYLQLGKLETEDFVAVAQNVGKWNFVDKDRIGIMGWSYGGYMTSLAMTKGAPYFKMGIAVAPVTNWRYYDNIYTERFMRTPQENPDGYDDNSPINYTDLLEGDYLLIHGSGDDNVHVQNSMEMINSLVKANKQFDMFIYPNKNHGIYGGNTRNHLYNMMLAFILNHL
ncbi:MAG: S9 family peptidase [Brumimicrobium sp.]|nr:S9 family peptidase [Brumimicrobium sp.]